MEVGTAEDRRIDGTTRQELPCEKSSSGLFGVVAVSVALVLISGCASTQKSRVWTKPGSTQQSFAQDRYERIKDARTPYSNTYVDPVTGAASSSGVRVDDGIFVASMEAKGYEWVIKE